MSAPDSDLVRRSRGMRDLLPADMLAFRRVEDAFREAAGRWGYAEIRTPAIETYSLFTQAGALTPQMLARVYSFLDWDGWSGERVVLRPDSTIPVARAAAEANLRLPARLSYVQSVFRFREEGDREDWQCGLEYLGAPPSLGELEVIAVGGETLDALGVRATVRIAHVGVTHAVAEALLVADGGPAREVLDRVAEEGIVALRPLAAGKAAIEAFIAVAMQRAEGPALAANLEGMATANLAPVVPALRELREITTALTESGRRTVIDLAMPADFEYYSGVVFEFDGADQTWGRGGRYTVRVGSSEQSACGLAIEVARLAERVRPTTRPLLTVGVSPAAPSDLGRAIDVARALHRSGIPAALASGDYLPDLAVLVSGSRLTARTPDGTQELAALDDVVGLLVDYK